MQARAGPECWSESHPEMLLKSSNLGFRSGLVEHRSVLEQRGRVAPGLGLCWGCGRRDRVFISERAEGNEK